MVRNEFVRANSPFEIINDPLILPKPPKKAIFTKILQPMIKSFDKANPAEQMMEDVDVLTEHEEPCSLIVWNDEVNSFEWVIETLMEVCGHSAEQAEQCAYIIHFRGKYAVKFGSYDDLKPQCDAITDRGIGATIEVTV